MYPNTSESAGGAYKPNAGAGAPKLNKTTSRMAKSMRKVRQNLDEDSRKMLRNAVIRRQHMEQMQLLHSNDGGAPRDSNAMESGKGDKKGIKKANSDFTKSKMERKIEEHFKGHPPHFTLLATFVQLILIIGMVSDGGLADWGMGIAVKTSEVEIFDGTATQTVQRPENPYLGPGVEALVKWGSKWAPCMREESRVLEFQQESVDNEVGFGCCINSDSECGMMTQDTCENEFGATFTAVGQSCADSGSCTAIKLRPCCFGIYGQCALLTKQHCGVLNGLWNSNGEVCTGNTCIFDICGMTTDDHRIAEDTHPNQFYRFIVAMFLHVGVIHFVMNALGQYVLVSQVEYVAGFWRTGAIYIMSGAGGFLISALFSADLLSNGASAAIYGMLGAETVDLFQTWQLLEDKSKQVIGLVLKLVIFLGIGTLPYIDNFAHVGGFVAGVVAAIWLLPFIAFGAFDRFRKRALQIIAMLMFAAVCIGLLNKFYTDHQITCGWCRYINCVPYTSSTCQYDQEDATSS